MGMGVSLSKSSSEQGTDLLLAPARETFDETGDWLLSEGACEWPAHEVEAEIERRGRETNRRLYQAHLDRRGTGKVGSKIEVEGHENQEDRTHRIRRIDSRGLLCTFGEVTVRRTAYVAEGYASIYPLDQQLTLPERSFSYEMQQRMVLEAVRGPFGEAGENLLKTTGNVIAKRSMAQIVEDAAQDFDAFYAEPQSYPEESTGSIVIGAVDCKGVPLMKKDEEAKHSVRRTKGEKANKKKMATVAAVLTWQPRVRSPEDVVASLFDDESHEETWQRPRDKRVWASLLRSKEDVIAEMAIEMQARDPDEKKPRVVVTDGERALQLRVKRTLPHVVLVLDFLHVLEKLWDAGHAFYGEGTPAALAWVRDHALMVLRGKAGQVVKGMNQSATKRKLRGPKKKAIADAARYLYRNRDRMRYHDYLKKGFPIASGAVEGACKNLVKDRMERSGMRWQIPGAEAMLKLRAIKLSGHMEAYWKFHIQRDQERLHGKINWKIV